MQWLAKNAHILGEPEKALAKSFMDARKVESGVHDTAWALKQMAPREVDDIHWLYDHPSTTSSSARKEAEHALRHHMVHAPSDFADAHADEFLNAMDKDRTAEEWGEEGHAPLAKHFLSDNYKKRDY